MQHLVTRKVIAHNLEALRGFVALVVVIGHIIYNEFFLDFRFYPYHFKFLVLPGHLGVLIFFVLSGYVIGLSNKKMGSIKELWAYLKKRFIRLYPIYFLSIILAVIVTDELIDFQLVLGNLTFTQIFLTRVISSNTPSWSLQYEVIYYLLFIPILFFKLNPKIVVLISLLVGVINFFITPIFNVPAVTSYSIGFVFWASGLTLAKSSFSFEKQVNFTRLISFLFLILSLTHFNVFITILSKMIVYLFGMDLKFPGAYWAESIIRINDLAFLPYCLLFILIFSEKKFKYDKHITLFLQLFPSLTFIFLLKNFKSEIVFDFIYPSIFYILSCILFFYNSKWINFFSKRIIDSLIWVGSFSYGIYIIHFPLLIIFKRIEFFSGSMVSFLVRFVLYIILTLSLAFFLEKKFQLFIKKHIVI